MVTERGAEYTPIGRPKGFRKMRDKACFWNALRAACERPSLRYAEGFALTRFGWTHHAWVVDDQDHAIEVTWAQPGERYIGIAFTSAKAAIAAKENYQGLGGPAFKLLSGDENAWQPPGEEALNGKRSGHQSDIGDGPSSLGSGPGEGECPLSVHRAPSHQRVVAVPGTVYQPGGGEGGTPV